MSTNEKGDVLLHCHSGCEKQAILEAVGLKPADLFVDQRAENTAANKAKPVPTDEYVYTDEHEQVLYKVVRYVPKTFKQARLVDGEWVWNLTGVERVPYRLPGLLEAIHHNRWVFFVEGEKDADTLSRMGFVATTTAGGSGSWSDAMAPYFKDARLVILPDNDQPGRSYADRVAAALLPVAQEIRVLELPGVPKKGDVTDYFVAGGTADELKALVSAAEGVREPALLEYRSGPLRYTRASDVATEKVEWLWDARIAYGKITMMDGDPGTGKSTLTLSLAAKATREGCPVILLSAEDGNEDTIVPRLAAAQASLDHAYIIDAVRPPQGAPERPWALPGDLEYLRTLIIETGARLVVIDPLTAFFGEEINSNNDHSVRRALHPLKDLASDTGCAMLIVRHLKKSREGLAMLQGGGSVGIIGAARVGLTVAKDPHDESGRRIVVAVSKNNLAPIAPSLAYHLEATGDVARVVWDGESPHTAETLLAVVSPEDTEEVGRAAEYLKLLLKDVDWKVPELLRKTRAMGITDKTLHRAKKMLGLVDIVNAEGVWWGLDITPTNEGVQT